MKRSATQERLSRHRGRVLRGALAIALGISATAPPSLAAARPGPRLLAPMVARPPTEGSARCEGVTLREKEGPPPFHSGEELAYEFTVGGVYIGRFETKVGRPRNVNGQRWLSFFGRARTNSFASSFKRFVGRYMALAEPKTLRPMGLRSEGTYGDDPRWEKVQFLEGSTKLTASFLYQGREGSRTYDKDDPLTDILTMLYFARTREMPIGAEVCQEVFGARWLWRMHAKVEGLEQIDTPAGKKVATKVTARFQRSSHPDIKQPSQQTYEMDIFFAKDHTQAPLAFVVRADKVTAEGRLVRWSLDDRGEGEWDF